MNYNKSLKIKREGGSMTPAKSAVPQRQGKGLIGKRRKKRGTGGTSTKPIDRVDPRRRRRFKLPQGHGRPAPGPRSPKGLTPFKGVHRDTRRYGGPRRFKRRRIRNMFTRR